MWYRLEGISIITNEDAGAIKERLLGMIHNEFGEELGVNIENNSNVVNLEIENNDAKPIVTNAIAQTIIDNYEKKMLYKVIHANYYYFNLPEKRRILDHSLSYIASEHNHMMGKLLAKRRLNIINNQINEFLKTEHEINLDGFVNFRLQDYISELEEIVDKAVDDFMVEKEYNEFIRLLKYFVDIQAAKYEVLHIVATSEKKYRIYDTNKKEITEECTKDITKSLEEETLNEDDMLISTLITLAPKKIYIHHPNRIENKEMLGTIEKVFTKKISHCDGCALCNKIL